MTAAEMVEFVKLKSRELNANFPTDDETVSKVTEVSGGLPLATQWIIGHYKKTRRLDSALDSMKSKDSPVLEFSFRNIWNTLDAKARTVLALMSIFDGPLALQEMVVASEMEVDIIEAAFSDLFDVTLVNRVAQQSDGRTLYSALPITLSFARNQLGTMGELEIHARQRVQRFTDQMELQVSEVARFRGEFDRYGLNTPNEKKAAILCRRAESEMFSGNADSAELLFQQARDLAPQSAYVHAKSAAYELARNRVGTALERVNEACNRATAKTGGLCYTIKARILDVQRNKRSRVEALEKALSYEPDDHFLRHQYGVALSRVGREENAIHEFTKIIDDESTRVPPRETLIMAMTTRIINFSRLGRRDKAMEDLRVAREIIRQYPHLKTAATAGRLDDLESEITT